MNINLLALLAGEVASEVTKADLKDWALAAIAPALVIVVIYFLRREHARFDAATEAIKKELKENTEKTNVCLENLNRTTAELALAIRDIKEWTTERFISRAEFDRTISGIKDQIDTGKRLEILMKGFLRKEARGDE
jgi:hypothetical protein